MVRWGEGGKKQGKSSLTAAHLWNNQLALNRCNHCTMTFRFSSHRLGKPQLAKIDECSEKNLLKIYIKLRICTFYRKTVPKHAKVDVSLKIWKNIYGNEGVQRLFWTFAKNFIRFCEFRLSLSGFRTPTPPCCLCPAREAELRFLLQQIIHTLLHHDQLHRFDAKGKVVVFPRIGWFCLSQDRLPLDPFLKLDMSLSWQEAVRQEMETIPWNYPRAESYQPESWWDQSTADMRRVPFSNILISLQVKVVRG